MHTLISFVGRGRRDSNSGYAKASYRFEDGSVVPTSFLGLALARKLRPDRVVLLGTSGSMWDALVEHFEGTLQGEEALLYELIEAVDERRVEQSMLSRAAALAAKSIGCEVEMRIIPFGSEDAGQRRILEVIAEAAPTGLVSLDVTHGFRHLPMLGLVSAFVVQRLGRTVGGLYYGALDMTAEGVTPVLRLDGLLGIERWVEALARFDSSGDFAVFASLLALDGVPEAKTRLLEEAAFYERNVNIADATQRLKAFFPVLDQPLAGASELFRGPLRQRLGWFRDGNLADHQDRLATEYLNRGDFVRGVALTYESFVSRLCVRAKLDPLDYPQRERQEWEFLNKTVQRTDEAVDSFRVLKQLRNSLVHGTRPGPGKPAKRAQEALRSRTSLISELERCRRNLRE